MKGIHGVVHITDLPGYRQVKVSGSRRYPNVVRETTIGLLDRVPGGFAIHRDPLGRVYRRKLEAVEELVATWAPRALR